MEVKKMKTVKTRLSQYLERVEGDQLTGEEVMLYGDYFKVPTKGQTGVLNDCGTQFKYDFGKGTVILVDVNGKEVISKQVALDSFLAKQWKWLNIIKREAQLLLNLDEESLGEEVAEPVYKRTYYGYLDEEGDVIDMREADDAGNGAKISTFEDLGEEADSYKVTEGGDIYLLNEAKLAKDSNPMEGFVYWDKKHGTAYYVVAVYEKASDEKKQVSYWSDEGQRLTSSIKDFKAKMVPSNDVEDYEIFEECSTEGEVDDLDEELAVAVTAVNGKMMTLSINGRKYSYLPNEGTGFSAKDLKAKFDAMAKHNAGRALAWLKKNATTKDSYKKQK